MLVNYIIGERTGEIFGQSRYQKIIYAQLRKKVNFNVIGYGGLKFSIFSMVPKHVIYPTIVRRKIRNGIVHIASHEQAHILDYIGDRNVTVTVFDLALYVFKNVYAGVYGGLANLLHKLDVPLWIEPLKKRKPKLMAISEFTKKEIMNNLNYPSEKIDAIHLGVDLEKYRPLTNFEKPECFTGKTVLYTGAESFRKNIPTLIKAFYKLKKKVPNVKLVKVGRPEDRQGRKNVLELVNELKLGDNITFVGYVPEEDLPLFYNSADLFVFPSLYEGFGLPPLEAMACGLPVVASNTSSLPEVIGDAGIMKDPYDVDGFASAMHNVLTNDGLREDMVKKGLKRAKLFSWEKTAIKTLKVYEEISRER
ncbi:MAG: hypothetical protein AVW06_04195 [Hadesarchaea archaeon DG-33-1]|nr:MAG: hypothetical protein AVW06_04195 [Hadesarchaea archaeon DG-33-1]